MISLAFVLFFCAWICHSQRLFANVRTDDDLLRILQAYELFVYEPGNYEPFLYEEPNYDALLFGYNAFPDYEFLDYDRDFLGLFDLEPFYYDNNEYDGNKGQTPKSTASLNSTDSNRTDDYDYDEYSDFYDLSDSTADSNATDIFANETESAEPEAPPIPVQAPPIPNDYVLEYVYLGDPIFEVMPLFLDDADLDDIILV